MKLSIGIPTFNRPDALLKRLDELDTFREYLHEVVICDNSNTPDPRVLEAIQHTPWIRYSHNRSNIGGGANFLRVIEQATGDYLWWRGDDDPITAAQVEALTGQLGRQRSLIILSPTEKTVFQGAGIREFAASFSLIRSMGWFSMVVLPLDEGRRALPSGYWGIHSGWANICLVLGLFRVNPNLPFAVVPFQMEEGDFRDEGRKAMWWAFFETCIRRFPITANLIDCPSTRSLYLNEWRKTQRFKLLKTMTRLRLGLAKQEPISLATLWPLFSWTSPRTCLLAVALYGLSKVPRSLLRIGFAAYAGRFSEAQLKSLELDFLADAGSIAERFSLLKKHATSEKVGAFL